jgi:hypothetical protein
MQVTANGNGKRRARASGKEDEKGRVEENLCNAINIPFSCSLRLANKKLFFSFFRKDFPVSHFPHCSYTPTQCGEEHGNPFTQAEHIPS